MHQYSCVVVNVNFFQVAVVKKHFTR